MRYGGFRNNIETYKRLTSELATIDQSAENKLIRDELQKKIWSCGYMAPWLLNLVWSNKQELPTPLEEITQNEWLQLGYLGHESENDSFYDGLNIPGEMEWFGGWSCHIHIYYSYALVIAHMHSPDMPYARPVALGKGIISLGQNRYTVRFFRLGCKHSFVSIPEESSMHIHASRCTKCGYTQSIDSSG